jgi:hypothetical protein
LSYWQTNGIHKIFLISYQNVLGQARLDTVNHNILKLREAKLAPLRSTLTSRYLVPTNSCLYHVHAKQNDFCNIMTQNVQVLKEIQHAIDRLDGDIDVARTFSYRCGIRKRDATRSRGRVVSSPCTTSTRRVISLRCISFWMSCASLGDKLYLACRPVIDETFLFNGL